MCQWGAYEYSRLGWTYLQILDHYYNMDWYYNYGEGAIVEVAEVPAPPLGPAIPTYDTLWYTLLNNLTRVLQTAAARLGGWADGVKGVPIVGAWLFPPLDFLAIQVDDGSVYCHEFALKALGYQKFVYDLLYGTLFGTLIQNHLPSIGTILADPVAWVNKQVAAILGPLAVLRDFPGTWLRDQLFKIAPWTREFLDDPAGFIVAKFKEKQPLIGLIFTSPFLWLLYLLRDNFPDVYWFFLGPERWVKSFLEYWLNASPDLWIYHWGYIWQRIGVEWDKYPWFYGPWFRSKAAKVLRYLFEGVWAE
jgi:hypothetical protein